MDYSNTLAIQIINKQIGEKQERITKLQKSIVKDKQEITTLTSQIDVLEESVKRLQEPIPQEPTNLTA